jgi:hypothetical protein
MYSTSRFLVEISVSCCFYLSVTESSFTGSVLKNISRNDSFRKPAIVFPGGSSPRPPFSRFARCAVTGWAVEQRLKERFLQKISYRASWGPRPPFSRFARCAVTGWAVEERLKERFLQKTSYRGSWGILPQTPVFSLRSVRCHWLGC